MSTLGCHTIVNIPCASLGADYAPGIIKVPKISHTRLPVNVISQMQMHELVKLIEDAFKEFERLQIGATQQFQGRSYTPVVAFEYSQGFSNFPLTYFCLKRTCL